MPRIPYVPINHPGPIADAIRARRGERGIQLLDRSLLQAPAIAEGWNKLLGAVRTGSSLGDDLRELMILRVAIRNGASYEWIQHAPVAQKAGVTEGQLATVGDVYNQVDASRKEPLSAIQQQVVMLADEMTQNVRVSDETFSKLRAMLSQGRSAEIGDKETTEAVLTVATYNLVSRFLVAMDVADRADVPCPVPGLPTDAARPGGSLHYPRTRFDYSHGLVQVTQDVQLATKVHFHSVQAPWIVLVNSLMTNLTMWDAVIPSFAKHFNIITYDQRGHGASSTPSQDCTLDELADDVAAVMDGLGVERAHAVIGVSQGGATALNFAVRHGGKRTQKIVACDTQPVSPQANTAAWDERKELARTQGMAALADVTVPRWFNPEKSKASAVVREATWQMIAATSVDGFAKSASALQGYDLVSKGLVEALGAQQTPLSTLLVAGSADGALPDTLKSFSQQVGSPNVAFAQIDGGGHLPMCDCPQEFVDAVLPWLLKK